MSTPKSQDGLASQPIRIIIVVLALWSLVLALGVYWYGYRQDVRKPLIIIGGMALFLAVWGLLLWRRSRTNRLGSKKAGKDDRSVGTID